MSKTLLVDFQNNLVQVEGVTKRLPIKLRCDHAFGMLAWNGTAGALTYPSGAQVPFTDAGIVAPFLEAFDLEPPQLNPERIGAGRMMDGPDAEWTALLERHLDLAIEIDALVKVAVTAAAEPGKAKADAERASRKAFQDHMNAVRKARGKPEVDYDARR
ncbi:MAG: hypothetical protein AB7Q01_15005 [Gammaproteobacteria bacterium]